MDCSWTTFLWALVVALGLAGCAEARDTGNMDASTGDLGNPDDFDAAPAPDLATPDAEARLDISVADAEVSDSAVGDAELSDSGFSDLGSSDAGPSDAGSLDLGGADMGDMLDAGPGDGGTTDMPTLPLVEGARFPRTDADGCETWPGNWVRHNARAFALDGRRAIVLYTGSGTAVATPDSLWPTLDLGTTSGYFARVHDGHVYGMSQRQFVVASPDGDAVEMRSNMVNGYYANNFVVESDGGVYLASPYGVQHQSPSGVVQWTTALQDNTGGAGMVPMAGGRLALATAGNIGVLYSVTASGAVQVPVPAAVAGLARRHLSIVSDMDGGVLLLVTPQESDVEASMFRSADLETWTEVPSPYTGVCHLHDDSDLPRMDCLTQTHFFDGDAWTTYPHAYGRSVTMSAGEVFTIAGHSTVLRWGDAGWEVFISENRALVASRMRKAGDGHEWAVGTGLPAPSRFSGSVWQQVALPMDVTIEDVYATSDNQLFLSVAGPSEHAVLWWDGWSWTSFPASQFPAEGAATTGLVAGRSSSDVYYARGAQVYHWDGGAWTEVGDNRWADLTSGCTRTPREFMVAPGQAVVLQVQQACTTANMRGERIDGWDGTTWTSHHTGTAEGQPFLSSRRLGVFERVGAPSAVIVHASDRYWIVDEDGWSAPTSYTPPTGNTVDLAFGIPGVGPVLSWGPTVTTSDGSVPSITRYALAASTSDSTSWLETTDGPMMVPDGARVFQFGAYVRVPFYASYFFVNTPEAAGPVRICPTNVLIP